MEECQKPAVGRNPIQGGGCGADVLSAPYHLDCGTEMEARKGPGSEALTGLPKINGVCSTAGIQARLVVES